MMMDFPFYKDDVSDNIKGIKRGLIKKREEKCRRLEQKQPKKESNADLEAKELLRVNTE